MTVGELIDELKEIPQDKYVYMNMVDENYETLKLVEKVNYDDASSFVDLK